MVDSELVTVGSEVAAWVADLVVVPEGGREGEQPESDARAEAGQGACSVALEPELSLAGCEHRLDPLADRSERPEAGRLVFAGRAQKARPAVCHERLELAPGEALVGDHCVARKRHPLEHFPCDLALG